MDKILGKSQDAGLLIGSGNSAFKIAVLGDSTTQFLVNELSALGETSGISLDIFESGFNQLETQLYDKHSDTFAFKPGLIIIACTAKKLAAAFYKTTESSRPLFYQEFLSRIESLIEAIRQETDAGILVFNLEEADDYAFGSYATKHRSSLLNQLRRINYGLMELAESSSHLHILDINKLHTYYGTEFTRSPNIYISTDLVHSLAFTGVIADAILKLVKVFSGKIIKCIVLDLDHTLWGGVIGDDGIQNIEIGNLGIGKAFQEFQYYLKHLKERGILLAICSKNTLSVAQEPFISHPEMVLRLTDIAIFVANWENKADNILHISRVLNLGLDSLVFIDDNPMERNLVKSRHPEVSVPDLPEDPAYYLSYIQSLNLFETTAVSAADAGRTLQYQQEAERNILKSSFTDINSFLAGICMNSYVRPFLKFDIPRIAQLSQRSNQFNLTTIRYSETEIEVLAADAGSSTFAFNLKDNLGDHGLVCTIIVRKTGETAEIMSWMMSCRVLKRTMERFCLNTIVAALCLENCRELTGKYIPTEKNALVSNHYSSLGFTPRDDHWFMNPLLYIPGETFITLTTPEHGNLVLTSTVKKPEIL